ncbi:MAG: PAS domain-containing protein [Alphaproteobacteria bacterium]|nr:PAS domain-containing protein [Alphaproteobacteria bacterium]
MTEPALQFAEGFRPDTIRSNRLRRFYTYWDARRGTRAMPARCDIDPTEVPWMLGYVSLHDVLPDGGFRFRVDASNTSAMFGIDMTGRRLDEYPIPDVRERIRSALETVVLTREPLRTDLDYATSFEKWRYERLILPLGTDGRVPDMLMSAIDVAPMHEN